MREELVASIRREIINTPETADFMAGVPLEAAHQRDRGVKHDAGKTPVRLVLAYWIPEGAV